MTADASTPPVVLIELDTVLIEQRDPKRDAHFVMRPVAAEGLERLAQLTHHLFVLIDPQSGSGPRRKLGDTLDGLLAPMLTGGPPVTFVRCAHDPEESCQCRRPGSGLVELAFERHDLPRDDAWYLTGDQEGVQAGRNAGLRTIRIGPQDEDHRNAVHRADYEARDLREAANWLLFRSLEISGRPA